MNGKKLSSLALATAAAVMFSSAPLTAANAADEAKVKCEGVNACKSQSACGTASNACAGIAKVNATREGTERINTPLTSASVRYGARSFRRLG